MLKLLSGLFSAAISPPTKWLHGLEFLLQKTTPSNTLKDEMNFQNIFERNIEVSYLNKTLKALNYLLLLSLLALPCIKEHVSVPPSFLLPVAHPL